MNLYESYGLEPVAEIWSLFPSFVRNRTVPKEPQGHPAFTRLAEQRTNP